MLVGMHGMGGTTLSAQLAADTTALHNVSGSNTYSGVSINSNGNQYWYSAAGSATGTLVDAWLVSGTNSDFWVRCTLNSGSLGAGSSATGSWIACTSTTGWFVLDTDGSVASQSANFDIDIATDSGGSNIVATETYTPFANYVA